MGFWNYFEAIVVVCAVMFAAYYVTKLVARAGGGNYYKGAGIKLVGSLPLGKDKSVAVVEVGGYAYILGVSAQRVERLDKIPMSELKIEAEVRQQPNFSLNFKNELNARIKKFYGQRPNGPEGK